MLRKAVNDINGIGEAALRSIEWLENTGREDSYLTERGQIKKRRIKGILEAMFGSNILSQPRRLNRLKRMWAASCSVLLAEPVLSDADT